MQLDPPPPSTCVHLSLTPPPPCGRHKWIAPNHRREVSPCIQILKSLRCVVKSAKKGRPILSKVIHCFVPCLYVWEGHRGPDLRPSRIRSGSGPRGGVLRPPR